ncbi:hypothetical protein QX51_02950 [Terrisporobacter othiniensis]|uniref:Multicopper oxidase n=2 Tax=Terrisporobacter othiniensis TaxID=1577792 RepID=A0A0B3W023_9FIRM|nr:hypothetical protein QX51_02950 [Terrisporobacter othiniensis]
MRVDIFMKKLNPSFIPKFQNELEKLPIFAPSFFKKEDKMNHHYSIDACEFYQQMLPEGFNKTKVWGFAGFCKDEKNKKIKYVKHSPGPTFEVDRNIDTNIQWNNKILGEYMFKIDKTLVWANPNNIVYNNNLDNDSKEGQWPPTLIMHVHGISTPPIYDGNPRAWYTATGIKGPVYSTNYYKYTNEQRGAMLWYYDQSPGVSRYSVYSGLCGLYFIKDEKYNLPKDEYHIPLIIQDKSFYEDGSLFYDNENVDSNHPYWKEKFFGDIILVNGKVWPSLNVKNQLYRFNILNGSNSRPYKIALSDNSKMIQIGSDGGYIDKPQELSYFSLYPGERIDLLIDFSRYNENNKIIMKNLFSSDECKDIMEFNVISIRQKIEYNLPKILTKYPPMKINTKKKSTILLKREKGDYRDGYFINNETYLNPPNIITKVGSTFIWEFINLCDDDICIHIHLTNFQILERQKINKLKCKKMYDENKELSCRDEIYEGAVILPELYEEGFKDTLYCPPSFITRIIIRYAPTYIMEEVNVGENYFSFNTSNGPEYIINSQILEQKDNYLVRPQIIFSEE